MLNTDGDARSGSDHDTGLQATPGATSRGAETVGAAGTTQTSADSSAGADAVATEGLDVDAIIRWIVAEGIRGADELGLLTGVCERLNSGGMMMHRGFVGLDTLHPINEALGFQWTHDDRAGRVDGYTRAEASQEKDSWHRSPFFHMIHHKLDFLRPNIADAEARQRFPILQDFYDQGVTDYVVFHSDLNGPLSFGEMESLLSSWTTFRPGGFNEADLRALRDIVPVLSLAMKSAMVTRVGRTLVETYLGHDAAERVIKGNIERGVTEPVHAVLWYSDLQGFTKIADTAPPEQLIPFLNDYTECIVTAIHAHGGQVMKFMGDGLLAVFDIGGTGNGCVQALDAADDAMIAVESLSDQRTRAGLPVTSFHLALHVGTVQYGNIGSLDRLDFTIVGPAVNELSRIEQMCRSLDQSVLISADFAQQAVHVRNRVVSLGRYALRGIRRPRELFTLDPTSMELMETSGGI